MRRALPFLLLLACTKKPEPSHDADASALLIPIAKNNEIVLPNDSGIITMIDPTGIALGDVNGDGVDDVIALASIKSNNDDQERLLALDGNGKALVWASPRLQPLPSNERPKGAHRSVHLGAGKVALAHGWREIELFDAATGAPTKNLRLAGVPGTACEDARPNFVSFTLLAGTDLQSHAVGTTAVDLATTTLTEARCKADESALALETANEHPVVTRLDPATKKQLWRTEIAPGKPVGNMVESSAVHFADLSAAGVLVVINRDAAMQTWSQRLVMLDPDKGTIRWERDLMQDAAHLGLTEKPHVVGKNLVVPLGISVELWDPATGEMRHTFGPAMGVLKGSKLEPK